MKYNKEEIEEFVNKIQSKSGFVDVIDAYRLVSYYTDVFGVRFIENISPEEELIIYYDELKSVIMNGTLDKKKCSSCNEVKSIEDYSKRKEGYEYKCKVCIKIYSDKRKEYRKNIKNKLEI